jgi:hypothetical protein
VHRVIPLAASYNWNNGGALMTLILPLGFFIVVMVALYFVFTRPHTVPGRRPITGARPVAPADPGHAASLAAATGLPTATAAGGAEPLAGRATPPPAGARTEEAIQEAGQEVKDAAETAKDKVTGGSGKDQDAATEGSEDQE